MNTTPYRTLTTKWLLLLSLLIIGAFSASAQVSLTATAGTSTGTFTTLKACFDAINSGTHQGMINISVTASTTETASAVLNASGSGAASYTSVYIKPAASTTPTIGGSISSDALIKLNGAKNVTIDGSNNGTTTRDLTITNTSTTAPITVWIGSVGTTAVTGDSIKNCNIIHGVTTSTALIVSDATTVGAAGYFNDITIRNNNIQRAYIGTYIISVQTGTNGNNTVFAQNYLNTTGTNAIRYIGLYMQGVYGGNISENTIGNFITTNAEYDRGIWLATGTNNTTVANNNISGLNYSGTGAYAPMGISISPNISNASLTISGNTVTNLTSSGSGTTIGLYLYAASSGVVIEKNKVSNIKNTNTTGYGCAGIGLGTSLTASNVLVASNFVWDIAAVGVNGYAATNNGNGIVVDGGGGYDVYYNTVVLNTNQQFTGGNRAAAFLVTANVTASSSINLKNNILANLQTVGNGNSRFALVNNGASSVFASMDYNDYYSTSGNLTSQGTNASITTTLAQVQAAFGSNTNSLNILPGFVGANDLHLTPGSNTGLDNVATVITGVTTDIDNDPRNATTPDIGADEFDNCLTINITGQPNPITICEGDNTTFQITAANSAIYQWQQNTGSGWTDITNGGVYSGATSANLSLSGALVAMDGYSYRCLAKSAPLCAWTSSAAVILNINAKPNVAITTSGSTSFCTGGNVTLSVPSGSNLNYSWTDGTTQVGSSASYVANTTGTYTVAVVNTTTGCSDTSSSINVAVGNGPISIIAGAANQFICPGSTISLHDVNTTPPGATYQWAKDGTTIPGATNASMPVNDTGSYTMTISIGPGCNTTSAATRIYFYTLPAADVLPSGSINVCQGNTQTLSAVTGSSLTYQWHKDGNDIPGAVNASYNAGASGLYTVTVINTATGCTKTTSVGTTINIVPLPIAYISPTIPTTACDSMLLMANTDPNLTYQWNLNSNIIPNATNINHMASLSGTYTLITRDQNNCVTESSPVAITINPSPTATVTYNQPLTFCEGGAVALTAYDPGGYTYQWVKDGVAIAGGTNAQYIADTTGNMAVIVENSFGCIKISPVLSIKVNPLPDPVIVKNLLRLSTDPYASYQWFYNNTPISGATDSVHNATQNGGYRVVVVDTNGCTNSSETIIVNNVGVSEIAGNNNFKLYPNPFSNTINVNTISEKITSIELYNVTGALVARKVFTVGTAEANITTGELADGMYMIKIATDSGTYTGKMQKAGQ